MMEKRWAEVQSWEDDRRVIVVVVRASFFAGCLMLFVIEVDVKLGKTCLKL
jgi:hypothetical protein